MECPIAVQNILRQHIAEFHEIVEGEVTDAMVEQLLISTIVGVSSEGNLEEDYSEVHHEF